MAVSSAVAGICSPPKFSTVLTALEPNKSLSANVFEIISGRLLGSMVIFLQLKIHFRRSLMNADPSNGIYSPQPKSL